MRQTPTTSLDYSSDTEPGISRVTENGQTVYRGPGRRLVRGRRALDRIGALVIPPAWTDVWICANSQGHIQATGKDVRGRKQYRYHPAWIAERDSDKFDSLRDFALLLPRIRRRVRRDLARPGLDKPRVLAAIVQLMDRTFIRVGGERYRKENGSFGATTLHNRHVKLDGHEIYLDFRGKSGKQHQIEIRDARVASVIRRCLDIPGHLFQYREGEDTRTIGAADVNQYLREISGSAVTSKDFRTWGGTVHATEFLARARRQGNAAPPRKLAREAVKAAAKILGNTPAVCRKSYIHPKVLSAFESDARPEPWRKAGLRDGERLALALLEGAADAAPVRLVQRRTGARNGSSPTGTARVRARSRPANTDVHAD